MPSIKIDIDTSALEAKMQELQQRFNPVGLLKAVGERALVWIDENFGTEGGNVGGWEPLAESTIAAKGSSAILQDTGRLRQSFDYELEGDGTVRVGTNVEYAAAHEEGVGPYRIESTNPGGVLAFMGSDGMIFVQHVDHPGIPQRRMLPDREEGEGMAQRMVDAMLENLGG